MCRFDFERLYCFLSEQGLPYDVLLDNGERLIKIQVKTTQSYKSIPQRNIESKAYIFNIKRCGNGNSKRYKEDKLIFAFKRRTRT